MRQAAATVQADRPKPNRQVSSNGIRLTTQNRLCLVWLFSFWLTFLISVSRTSSFLNGTFMAALWCVLPFARTLGFNLKRVILFARRLTPNPRHAMLRTSILILGTVQAFLCPQVGLAQGGTPRLERVSMPLLDSIGPEKADAIVAISPTGMVAFTGAFDERDRILTLLDDAGRLVGRFGAPGSGPGELSVPLQLTFTTRELIAVELSSRRISRFGLDGSSRGTAAMTSPVFLAAGFGDSIDVYQFPTGSQPVLDFKRISPLTMDGRVLLSGQSPGLRDLSSEGQQQGAAVASIVYAAVGGTVVAVNVATYRLVGFGPGATARFDVRGKSNAPPGETPLLAIGGVQVDGRQRLWAIGADQTTGRSFADVWNGSQLLGRLDLPCRGTVALSGTWLAILCSTPNASSRDVALQIYRVVEPR